MKQYNDLVLDVLENGSFKPNARTGKGTLSVFGRQVRFDLQKELPLVTSKYTNWQNAYYELLWYLKGTGDISFLKDLGVNIWDDWVIPGTSDLGPVYGKQWRKWERARVLSHEDWIANSPDRGDKHNGKTFYNAKVTIEEIDQVKQLIDKIKNDPSDRRMIVNAWNVSDLENMQLPPCHMTWQCNVVNGKLNMHLLQRSVDVPIGLPWNWICYSMLTHMIAHVTGLEVGEFVWTGVDVHIYEDQIEKMKEMLHRPLLENTSILKINRKVEDIDDFAVGDISVENYNYHKFMKIPVAV